MKTNIELQKQANKTKQSIFPDFNSLHITLSIHCYITPS